MANDNAQKDMQLDSSSSKEFYDYYAGQSIDDSTVLRMQRIRDIVLKIWKKNNNPTKKLNILDVGCGAGTLSRMWSELGHEVHGIDINQPLIELANKRAMEHGLLKIDFRVGTATALPWPDQAMDVCTAPELLEHVTQWETCLNEFSRVLKPGGVLYLSTSNKLCPKQDEYTLPLYSWYPSRMKRHYEKRAVTTHPHIANYAKYPAVNWFSFYQLRDKLNDMGFDALDRFDIMDVSNKHLSSRAVRNMIVSMPPFR